LGSEIRDSILPPWSAVMLSTWMGHPRLLVVRASFLPVSRIQDLLPWGIGGTDWEDSGPVCGLRSSDDDGGKKGAETQFARMRHELFMAANGTVAAPNGKPKRAGDGDADDCGCDCVRCDGGDCDNCSCDSCECEGCACDSAVAKAEKARAAEFDRMRHELAIARV
jgi:hypothetical protein